MIGEFLANEGAHKPAVLTRRKAVQFLLLSLLVSSVFLVVNAFSFKARLADIRIATSGNIGWVVAQLEVDYQGLLIALEEAQLDQQNERNEDVSRAAFKKIQTEFDILYSRVGIFNTTILRFSNAEIMRTQADKLVDLRDELATSIDAITHPNPAFLLALQRQMIDGQPIVREATVMALQEITNASEVSRTKEQDLFTKFFLQSIFLFTILGIGTSLALRLWYDMEASSRENAQISSMLTTALNSTLNGVVVTDEAFNIIYCNDYLLNLLGFEQTALLGRPVTDVLSGASDSYLRGNASSPTAAIAEKTVASLNQRNTHLQTKDGRLIPVEVAFAHDENLRGSRLYVGFVRDISRRLQAEQKQKEALKQAHEAAQAKSRFLATMSHEMRTPLHGLIASLDLLGAGDLDETMTRLLNTAVDCSNRALMQVDDILELTRLESRRETPSQFSPKEIALDIVGELRPLAEQSGNRIDLIIMGEFEKNAVEGLPLAFSRALYNLVGNAVKFTRSGIITVNLSLSDRKQNSVLLSVHVEDTGPGIPEQEQQRIFEKFETGARGKISTQTGTGLGLSIAKLAIEHQGGQLCLSSEVGVGSRFYFSIPLQLVSEPIKTADTGLSGQTTPIQDVMPETSGNKRILVVDDNQINLTLMSQILLNMGHRIAVARNGQEALDKATDEFFDVILMDFSMPVMDGLTAARLIRESGCACSQTVIIGLTAFAQAEADYSQLDSCLIKPVTGQQVSAAIAGATHAPHQERSHPELTEADGLETEFETAFLKLCQLVDGASATQVLQKTLEDASLACDTIGPTDMPLDDVADVIHKAVGSTGCVGLLSLSETLSAAETLARAGCNLGETDLQESIRLEIKALKRELAEVTRQQTDVEDASA